MLETPPWLVEKATFPHREAIEALLSDGGTLRRDSRVHIAGQLVGTYQIRLSIAKDPKLNPHGNPLVSDLERLVNGLNHDPMAEITAWFIRDKDEKVRFWVFESRSNRAVIASINFLGRAAA